MGSVYQAEQEAHALGRLQHPGIAQIYEAGTADSGFGPQPYFAMEFIEGRTLIEFAEQRHLNLRTRLELTAKICDTVNHAHQRGIIHRDLKPANILVDEAGQMLNLGKLLKLNTIEQF
jgi:serine/threonine protein kinase